MSHKILTSHRKLACLVRDMTLLYLWNVLFVEDNVCVSSHCLHPLNYITYGGGGGGARETDKYYSKTFLLLTTCCCLEI